MSSCQPRFFFFAVFRKSFEFFSITPNYAANVFFSCNPSHAAGSHIAGPVVPTVPFWKSLSSVARQPNLTKFSWLHGLSTYAQITCIYCISWLIVLEPFYSLSMHHILHNAKYAMLCLQSQETLPSEPPWRVARLRSRLPVWSFEPLGPAGWEAQSVPCLFRGSSLKPVNSLLHDMKVREWKRAAWTNWYINQYTHTIYCHSRTVLHIRLRTYTCIVFIHHPTSSSWDGKHQDVNHKSSSIASREGSAGEGSE